MIPNLSRWEVNGPPVTMVTEDEEFETHHKGKKHLDDQSFSVVNLNQHFWTFNSPHNSIETAKAEVS